ncbi:MAG: adenylate/guanylate cyclase domain-containing protein [Deltaproteobacteria bacterium]|nr:adenylate/guanylate cyclase domain-containing protein [Deltaproteobacteria bacterium]
MRDLLKFTGFKLALAITLGFCLLKGSLDLGRFRDNFLTDFLDLVEMKVLDSKLNVRGKMPHSERVVILAADEKSMGTFGQWPWSHKVFADIMEKLTAAGVKVVGFDIIYAEPDTSDVACRRIFGRLAAVEGPEKAAALEKEVDETYGCGVNDTRFGEALSKSPAVLGYFFFTQEEEVRSLEKSSYLDGVKVVEPSRINIVRISPNAPVSVPTMVGVRVNIPEVSAGSSRMGYFNQIPDRDGLYRSVPMFFKFADNFYPSLSLATLQVALNGNIKVDIGTQAALEEGKMAKLMVGDKEIPLDDTLRFIVKYYGPSKTFRHLSAVDVWNGAVRAEDLKDKIVLFGVTTVGVFDLRPTPFESEGYPGVEIHANVIENILSEDFQTRPNMIIVLELVIMLVLGVVFGLLLTRLKLQYGAILVVVITLAFFVVDFQLFYKNGLHTKILLQGLQAVILLIGISVFRYFTEERDKTRIRKTFSTYVTKSVVEEVLRDPTKLQLGGQKKVLTVFFSDIRGFTSISEKLKPEQLVHQLNEYLTPMTNLVFKHEGTLDKYMGDAIMAIFGAPLDQPDHAARCCATALDMMDELKVLRASWKERGLPEINIGIGINTGEMIVGNMGSDVKFEYTVIGDNVNLGSRLEGVNKEYGTNIIISEFTQAQIAGQFAVRELDLIRVKGKKEPVKTFELVSRGMPTPEQQTYISTFEDGLKAFRTQKWEAAAALFAKSDGMRPGGDPPSKRYLERIEYLKENAPDADWDGVWVMKTK